jgi:hypothetical protein
VGKAKAKLKLESLSSSITGSRARKRKNALSKWRVLNGVTAEKGRVKRNGSLQ